MVMTKLRSKTTLLVLSAGKKSVTTVGETSNQFHARQNMQLIPSAGKHAIGAKRGKTYNRRKAQEAPILKALKEYVLSSIHD